MTFNHFKNFVILFLTVTSVYLTGQLWFEQISNRNFFYTFLSAIAPSQPIVVEERETFIFPSRIITNFGNEKFSIIYNDIEASKQYEDCHEVLAKTLNGGQFVGEFDIDWTGMLKNISYIYDYEIAFSSSFFEQHSNLSSKIKSFDEVFIIPSRSDTQGIRVLFVDNKLLKYFEYSITDDVLNDRIIGNIQSQKNVGLTYTSSKQTGLKMFESNVFIPQIQSGGFKYQLVAIENPYYDGGLLLDTMERKIDIFFENPASKWSGLTNDIVYTYGDENTVVKYYPNDVLEYSNYKDIHKRTPSTFTGDYYAAMEFLKKDTTILNEYFLADYKVDKENEIHTFYFDYSINNLPLILSDSMEKSINMPHTIEIVVENGTVTKYLKLAYTFSIDQRLSQTAELDFIGAMNSMFVTGESSNSTELEDAGLGYKIDKDKQSLLNWFLKINGRAYIKSATSTTGM